MIIKKSLPLTDHAEDKVVDDDDFYINVVVGDCGELLNVHHDWAVAGEEHDVFFGASEFCAHCRGETVAHCAQAAACQKLSRFAGFEKLCRPHLVLADVCHGDCIFVAHAADFADERAGLNRVAFFRPIERVLQTFFDGLIFPRGKFFGKVHGRGFQFIFEQRKRFAQVTQNF